MLPPHELRVRALRGVLSTLPLRVGITGRTRDAVVWIGDRLTRVRPGHRVETPAGALEIDPSAAHERLLAYAFANVYRHYARSPLGRLIAEVGAAEPGATFWDIGANLGVYSLIARAHGMKPELFEPEPGHRSFLARNAASLGRLHALALSDASGTADFYVAGSRNLGASSLVMASDGWERSPYDSVVQVEVVRLDELVSSGALSIEGVALIKIDVEGNEGSTVAGMRGALAAGLSAPIWCEVRGPASNRNANSYDHVARQLAEFGYRPWRPGAGSPAPIQPGEPLPSGVFDVLFQVGEIERSRR